MAQEKNVLTEKSLIDLNHHAIKSQRNVERDHKMDDIS